MARRLPPAPKERAASLAVSGSYRTPSPLVTPEPTPSPRWRINETDVLLYGFLALVILGLIVATRAVLIV